jgi:hypothetical protein
MPFHDSRFPPKNRQAEKLPVLRLEVEHAYGVLIKDLNDMAMAVIMKPDNLLTLKPVEGARSVLSGRPAVVYRSLDLEIPLAPDKLFRLGP